MESHLILSYLVSSHLILSYPIESHHILSYRISSHLILSCLVSSHLILSHLILLNHISSYLVSSQLSSSYLVSSYPIESNLISSQLISFDACISSHFFTCCMYPLWFWLPVSSSAPQGFIVLGYENFVWAIAYLFLSRTVSTTATDTLLAATLTSYHNRQCP